MKILNLNQSLADENDLCDFGDAGHPGVANQLRIQSQQSIRFLCVAAGSGLPLDQGAGAVQLSDRVDVGYEIVRLGKCPGELDLQVAAWLANADAVVLAEPVQELNPLLQDAVPGISVRVLQALVLAWSPLAEQNGRRVFAEEVGSQSPFEGSAEEHGGSRILLLPAIEIAVAITAWARQILADLGVAVEHQATSERPTSAGNAADSSSHWLAG